MAKHRKPNKHSARNATIVTGIAVTAFPTTQAFAADESTWDAVAKCESGNNWSIETGNGYSGGLQFLGSTWDSFGGREFAPRASQATKAEQIRVAERVLDVQGWNAWPVCSKLANATSAKAEPAKAKPTPSKAKPKAQKQETHTVVPGDWLSKIAIANDTTVAKLASDNSIANVDRIYPGQVLNLSRNAGASKEVSVPNNVVQTTRYTSVIKEAKQYLGVPYLWGGTSKSGIDCSALVQNAFAAAGKSVPRTSQAQYNATERVSRANLQPGDLGFIRSNGKVTHVVMYIGNNQIIESSRPGKPVAIRTLYSQINVFGRI